MNVLAYMSPANIADGLVSADVRLRFDDGSKVGDHCKVRIDNWHSKDVRKEMIQHLKDKLAKQGHSLTYVLLPDFTVVKA